MPQFDADGGESVARAREAGAADTPSPRVRGRIPRSYAHVAVADLGAVLGHSQST